MYGEIRYIKLLDIRLLGEGSHANSSFHGKGSEPAEPPSKKIG